MANIYIDLEAVGTGHAGTTGDPWSFQDFQNFAQNYYTTSSPETGYNFYLRGSVDINENEMYMVGGFSGFTYDAWDPSLYGPWRVRCLNFYEWIEGMRSEYRDPTGRISGGIFEFTLGARTITRAPMYNCFVKTAEISNGNDMPLYGCSFYCTNKFKGGDTTIKDCAISSPVIESQDGYNTTYINCAVNSINENDTYTDCQTDWVPTVAPAWDADQSAFGVSVLYAGVTTLPQPGNPPYTGYTTDLWGNPRTGIGAGLMGDPTTTTTTEAPTTTTTASPVYTGVVDISTALSIYKFQISFGTESFNVEHSVLNIPYTGTASPNLTADLTTYEYSLDGSTWVEMTAADGTIVDNLSFTSSGAALTFGWRIKQDITAGIYNKTIYVRFRATSTDLTTSMVVKSFYFSKIVTNAADEAEKKAPKLPEDYEGISGSDLLANAPKIGK